VRFHKDNQRLYIDTNKGAADLARLAVLDLQSGQDELVESDPLNRVDFGAAQISEVTDQIAATFYQDEKQRIYWKDKSFEADYKLIQKKLPGKEVRPTSHTKRRAALAGLRLERHRARRNLSVRPQN